MKKPNEKIRKAARIADVPLYRIAHELRISEPTITRWLREPLNPEREAAFLKAIDKIAKEEEQCQGCELSTKRLHICKQLTNTQR